MEDMHTRLETNDGQNLAHGFEPEGDHLRDRSGFSWLNSRANRLVLIAAVLALSPSSARAQTTFEQTYFGKSGPNEPGGSERCELGVSTDDQVIYFTGDVQGQWLSVQMPATFYVAVDNRIVFSIIDPSFEIFGDVLRDPEDRGVLDVVYEEVSVRYVLYVVDLDIDSDNNNGHELPDRSDTEETKEMESPGKLICLNNDDDNDNDTQDLSEDGPIAEEDNLVPIVPKTACKPEDESEARWSVSWEPDNNKIKVFKKKDKTEPITNGAMNEWPPPSDPLWVEGLNPGEVVITFEIFHDGTNSDGKDEVKATVFDVEIVHPIDSDFASGQTGRIMISTEHDNTYYTEDRTTAVDGFAQTEDRKVTISAYVDPAVEGARIYFEVIDPDDPVDQGNGAYREDQTPITPFVAGDAAAAPNTDPNDNRDEAKSMGGTAGAPGGTLAKYNNLQASLSARSDVTELKTIDDFERGVAEVVLTITNRYAGDNYRVRATCHDPKGKPFNEESGVTADTDADADIPDNILPRTSVLTAWKRVYLEIDKMFRVGADLSVDSGADQANKKEIHVATAGLNLAAGDTVRILDKDDQQSPFGETGTVASVEADKIVLQADMSGNYDIAKHAHVGKDVDASDGTFVAFYEADTSAVAGLFSDAFVEVKSLTTGAGPSPYFEPFTSSNETKDQGVYANRWFFAAADDRKNLFHIIGATRKTSGSYGSTVVPNHNTNSCFTFVKGIAADFAAGDVDGVNVVVTAHELTHQFDNDPAPPDIEEAGDCQAGVVPSAGGECIMCTTRAPTGAASKWCIYHVYTVRDEKDAKQR